MSAQPEQFNTAAPMRLLPQAPQAERGLLSSILIAPDYAWQLCEEAGVRSEHFHLPAHALIFTEIAEIMRSTRALDFVTLTQRLHDSKKLEEAGGAGYITDISSYMPTAANTRHYIEIVSEKFMLREIIRTGMDFANRGYEEQHQAEALLEEYEQTVAAIRKSDDSELREDDPQEAVMRVVQNIEELYDRRGGISGISTGFTELDELTDGLHPEEMIVIAARPSMGKTALGMNIAEHIAYEQGKTVIVFTLEMSTTQLFQRVLLSRSKVNMHRVRKGMLVESDFPRLTVAASKMAGSQKLRIVDAIGASIGAVRAKARRMAKRFPDLSCIVVDYLQKMKSTSKQAISQREREIAEISSGLKDMAKELRVPVVVLAQLNRSPEKRAGAQKGRPQMSDLRESGAIEQDADVIGMLYREEYYAETEDEKRDSEGKATLIIGKSRNGPTGDVPLTFLKEFSRFTNQARETNQ